jgi:hypothetical protein
VKHVTAIDNPLNGYVDGHSDSEDLGIFVLSPGVINIRNHAPDTRSVYFWFVTENRFNEEDEDFYDPSK